MIGLVFISDIKYCPYLQTYQQILDYKSIGYEVLFWNREGIDDDFPENFIYFDRPSEKNRSFVSKIADFIKFRKWLSEQIKAKKYDKLIFLSTLSGMLIADIALKEYKDNYILDIRDFSYEHNKLFYKIEEKLVENSFTTVISSPGFKEFLPKEQEYLLSHNVQIDDFKHKKDFVPKEYGTTLNLVFIGGVRYFNHQKNILDRLKNDSRFNMIYHGSGIELDRYKKYVRDNDIRNVEFTGLYSNEEKPILLKNADIINNSYLTEKFMEVKYAISNKFYDGLIYGVPQLVETGTYKTKLVESNYAGWGLDVEDEKFADKLYEAYFSMDVEKFNSSKNNLLNEVEKDIRDLELKINNFIEK